MRRGPLVKLAAAGILCAMALAPGAALAHEGQPLAPHDTWQAWNWEFFTVTALLVTGVAYGIGTRNMWQAAGTGRGVAMWRVVAFGGGLLALFVALISPLEALAGVLFSAHMVQHLLLTLVAAPLLVLGRVEATLLWALPAARRRGLAQWQRRQRWLQRLWAVLGAPPAVWLLYAVGFWAWHAPPLYEAALRYEWVHVLEHVTFFATAYLFWRTLQHSRLRGASLSYGMAVLFVFTTALHGGLLGWLLTFTTQVWYPAYGELALQWGLTPLEDQQLAGTIMWAPAGAVYALAALLLLRAWLERLERQGPSQQSGPLPRRSGAAVESPALAAKSAERGDLA